MASSTAESIQQETGTGLHADDVLRNPNDEDDNSRKEKDDDDTAEKRSSSSGRPPEVQYYLPPGSCDDAQALLEREEPLTEQDVLDFVKGKTTPLSQPNKKREGQELQHKLVEAYHKRREEILDLAWKVWTQEAFIDEDGRLVPVSSENTNDDNHPAGDLPPLPPNRRRNDDNNVNNNNNDNNNDMAINNLPPLINNMNNNLPFPLDQEEEERRWTEQEERQAELAIARAIQRYRQSGVPDEEYVLLRVRPAERPERASLTFRRICFAVLAVVTAFICIMLQTLPLFPRDSRPDPIFDKLLYELAEIRHFTQHAEACPSLHRSPPNTYTNAAAALLSRSYLHYYFHYLVHSYWWSTSASSGSRPLQFWENQNNNDNDNNNIHKKEPQQQTLDCSDGVLHIPTKSVLVDSFFESSTKGEATFWEPYVLGVNVSWFLPCNPPPPAASNNNNNNITYCQSQLLKDSCQATAAAQDNDDQQQQQQEQRRCFRGIHDNIITDHEVGDALRLGAELIQEGGDHFDIHYDPQRLQDRLPTLLRTIRRVLRDTYLVQQPQVQQQEGNNQTTTMFLEPVAFRVSAVGPLDGNGVALRGSHSQQTSNYLLRILNRQNYIRWIEKHKRHNELARYSLPWPSRLQPFRDPCHLMADMEANPNFAIHTTVFLSNGAGRDFRGGVALYVDDHPSNANPRRKIQRGVTIDGSRGRLMVSTGGLENRRCRLPTREGVRAALQIWWSCDPSASATATTTTAAAATVAAEDSSASSSEVK